MEPVLEDLFEIVGCILSYVSAAISDREDVHGVGWKKTDGGTRSRFIVGEIVGPDL